MRTWPKTGGFWAGLTTGGAIVGIAEAAYRHAPWGWAALFYGALWALAGVVALLLTRMAPRLQRHTSFAAGMVLSVGLSILALLRFILVRDVFHEAPKSGLWGTAIAAVAALVVAGGIASSARWVHKNLRLGLPQAVGWTVPLAFLVGLAAHARFAKTEQPPKAPSARPLTGHGVILVVADTLRADMLGVYGAGPHRGAPATPNLDAFAKAGVVFNDVSAQASWTRPAMASMLTSRHVSGHDTMAKTAVLPSTLPTIASVLQTHGVKTGAVVTNYNLEPEYGFARGFDTYRYIGPDRYLGAPPAATRLAFYNLYRLLRERLWTKGREARFFYRSGADVNNAAFALLDELGDGGFFLWLHYMEPHDPYFAKDGSSYARVSDPHPPAAWATPMQAAYRDEVRRFDGFIGELWQGLLARGLAERVTVVVAADHGEEFYEHGGFYHGVTLYEEQLHVPLIIRGPELTPEVVGDLARQIDIAPTIVARFGVPAPASWEGRNLFSDVAVPEITFAEEDHEGNVLKALRRGQHKLIVANPNNPRGLPPSALYDLAGDPGETKPLSQPDLAVQLKKTLDAQVAGAKAGKAHAGSKPLDADAEAELRSLGYVQ